MPIHQSRVSFYRVKTIILQTESEYPSMLKMVLLAEDGDRQEVTFWGEEDFPPDVIDARENNKRGTKTTTTAENNLIELEGSGR